MQRSGETAGAVILTAVILLLILFSSQAKAGALNGYALCEGVILPSLLPVLVLAGTLMRSRSSLAFERLFGWLTERLLRLPRCCTAAILFGLTGGYPAGALLTQQLYRSGSITQSDAKRLLRFNFCGGAAFLVTAVGKTRYGSTGAGAILLLLCVLSSVIIAFIEARRADKPQSAAQPSNILPFADALCQATESAAKSLILMSAYILLCSALLAVLPLPAACLPLLEITNGLFAGEALPLPYCAFFATFGGGCIHLQLLGILREIGLPYFDFFLHRLGSALLAFFMCRVFLHFFPQTQAVFGNAAVAVHFSEVNTSLGVLMLLGCAVLIFDIENRKIKLHSAA